jgi:hypothetical protein
MHLFPPTAVNLVLETVWPRHPQASLYDGVKVQCDVAAHVFSYAAHQIKVDVLETMITSYHHEV